MDNIDKIMIYSSDQYHQALIVQEILAENNIEAGIVNRKDSSFLTGEVEVYVNPEDEEKAKALVENL
ncbi:MAG: DUF2007 domain-containing protein [Bacteroidia bacterium]|nr:DUF2007 domain-containing protein [Bacteroidia bacterium]